MHINNKNGPQIAPQIATQIVVITRENDEKSHESV